MSRTAEKIILGVLVLAIISVSSVFIAGLDKPQETQETEKTNELISLDEAKTIAMRQADGSITEAFLENQGGILVYEIEIRKGNLETEVKIDPSTGNILHIETEIEEEDEDEKEDVPITGSALERASAAALAHLGEGRVTETEIGDEEGYYEIEVTLNNGNEVDVHLDENFNILSVEN